MNESIKAAIAEHAIAEYPRECVGVIVLDHGQERYVACTNRAATPTEQFVLAAEDFARAEDIGEIVALVHSHPGGRAHPSDADRAMCECSGVPRWVIVSLGVQPSGAVDIDAWCEFGPSGFVAPLIGRAFVHGVHDCYSIVRDWYRLERSIDLPDFERRDDWWDDGRSSLYLANYRAAGFVDVGCDAELVVGDVVDADPEPQRRSESCGYLFGRWAFPASHARAAIRSSGMGRHVAPMPANCSAISRC